MAPLVARADRAPDMSAPRKAHRYASEQLVQLTLTRAQVRELERLTRGELRDALERAEREFDLSLSWWRQLSDTARDLFGRRAGHLGIVGMYYDCFRGRSANR